MAGGAVSVSPWAVAAPRCSLRSAPATAKYPWAGLTLSDGTLYGTTSMGGAGNYGTVFSVPVSGGWADGARLTPRQLGGSGPGDLTLGGNTLYGGTNGGRHV